MVKNPARLNSGPELTDALALLVGQGYASTGVEELADAAGISRSTFFRRFGSKEDMVFADHERILSRVEYELSHAAADPLTALADAATMVFREHVLNRETSLLRNRLLREVPALRDREQATMHRYERLFRQHLQAGLSQETHQNYAAVAFPAALVAVHNNILRAWLQTAKLEADELLDHDMTAQLASDIRQLTGLFRPALVPSPEASPSPPAVIVTILDPGAGADEVLRAVREALP